jgi:hypothetical protein
MRVAPSPVVRGNISRITTVMRGITLRGVSTNTSSTLKLVTKTIYTLLTQRCMIVTIVMVVEELDRAAITLGPVKNTRGGTRNWTLGSGGAGGGGK